MRRRIHSFLATVIAIAPCLAGAQELQRRTASKHPMEYYVSRPAGWNAARRWPVLVVIESANREFRTNAETFVAARKSSAFLLVAPLVVSNGGPRAREAPEYRYAEAVWKRIDNEGPCRFDAEGLSAVMEDVTKLDNAESRYFLTGWEAGGHTVFAMLFRHPELLQAAIPVTPNYLGRCMEDGRFSTAPERMALPVRVLIAGSGPAPWPNPHFEKQVHDATNTAMQHGYAQVTSMTVPGKAHGPLADEVIAYVKSLLSGSR